MQMSSTITKWRRDRAVSQVIKCGKRLRAMRASRAGIESATLDDQIARLEKRHAALISYLKSTA